MKVGDSRHATMLTIVALGAVGFVIIQVIPSKAGAGPVHGAQKKDDGALIRDDQPLGSSLTTDPFSHASLVVDRAKSAASSAATAQLPNGSGNPGSVGQEMGPGFGPRSETSPLLIGPMPGASFRPDPAAIPVKNAGTDRQFDQAAGVSVELQGVLKVKERTAFIAVDGEEAKAYRQGDLISAGVRLEGFWNEGVIVGRRGKSFRVQVGGTQKL